MPVVIKDKLTHERIPNVFWLDTVGVLKRFVVDSHGNPMIAADGINRLEVIESRSWVAMNGETVVDQSDL